MLGHTTPELDKVRPVEEASRKGVKTPVTHHNHSVPRLEPSVLTQTSRVVPSSLISLAVGKCM